MANESVMDLFSKSGPQIMVLKKKVQDYLSADAAFGICFFISKSEGRDLKELAECKSTVLPRDTKMMEINSSHTRLKPLTPFFLQLTRHFSRLKFPSGMLRPNIR